MESNDGERIRCMQDTGIDPDQMNAKCLSMALVESDEHHIAVILQ
jgi:hypothetical protein